jgi:hypothetical protein
MTRFYGRAPEGERLVEKVPHGHWKTTTFICGLRYNGVTAPFVLDGAMDGPHFLAYVEQILAPTLKKDDIVVNLSLRPIVNFINRQPLVSTELKIGYLVAITCRSPDEAHIRAIAAQTPSDRKSSISLTNFAQAGSSASSAWFSLSSATNLAFEIEAARRRPSSNGTSLSRVQ